MTSAAIKAGQYEPAEVEKMGPDSWAVKSSKTDERYAVTRTRLRLTPNASKPLIITKWKCGCPATTPACRHIVSVIVREMRARGWVTAVWTDWQEARRQRRKAWNMESNDMAFWVTGRPAPEVRRPHKRGQFVEMQLDPYGRRAADCYWMVDGYLGRVSTTIGG